MTWPPPDSEYDHLCMMPNAARYSFKENKRFCSLPKGHDPEETPHRAFMDHDLDNTVMWYGPWQDGSTWFDDEGNQIIPPHQAD